MEGTLGYWQPFRYRGYVFDQETGLYYLRSRYYRAECGRFICADVKLDENVYCYCLNNSVNTVDRDGFDAIWIQEANSAEGFGHSGLLVQDKDGNWYYFFWGPECEDVNKELISGTKVHCYFELVGDKNADMSSTAAIKKTLKNAGGKAGKRADLITSTYYFEGDYTETYNAAVEMAASSEDYSLIHRNCAQQTLSAFEASDSRFCLISDGIDSKVVPNVAASRVALLPRKKEECPWRLLIIDAFRHQSLY